MLSIWKDNDITYDMAQLKAQISTMSKAHVEYAGIEDLDQFISLGLQSLNPVSWLHWINIVALATNIIMLLLIFPVIFQIILSSISTVKREIYGLQLKNKKGSDATLTPVKSV